jgi:DNA-binding transcriptional MerR regulator/effector-binding domain-containing protein
MYSIGEFARLGAVSVRTLRHYDEIGLLRPAHVNPETGYRGYSADQLGQLNRILALKELGLSLAQTRQLLDGITVGELRGMLMLRRAQLEDELQHHRNQLLSIEGRLRYIEREGIMPADDIIVKKIPATGVVAIAAPAPGFGAENIVPVVNRSWEQFDRLGLRDLVKETGPYVIFYEHDHGANVVVYLALPVAEAPPAELPSPAQYLVLPEVEAAVTVRNGPAASIFPFVYHDLARWVDERGYHARGPGREVWVHEIDDVADVDQQVFEIQLPFTRPEAAEASSS